MSRSSAQPPGGLPVLSRGKHRSHRSGACFMEMAAYLAGERWSDHPRCTHPLLAEVARLVNDHTSDANRSRLAELIPSVIGLTNDDPHVDARIAVRCARVAMPIVCAETQNAMAVGILTADRVLAELDGRPVGTLEEQSRRALEQAPLAARWAAQFVGTRGLSAPAFRRRSAPNIVRCAVQGIAEACVPSSDELLHALLVDAIDDCSRYGSHEADRPAPRSSDAGAQPPARDDQRTYR